MAQDQSSHRHRPPTKRIGLISDTHGLLRAEAADFLAGCDQIIHAGDIGDPVILNALSAICPTTAVRGNNDRASWAEALPDQAYLRVGNVDCMVVHNISEIDFESAIEGRIYIVVSGHSHRPHAASQSGVLYVNPGSAGPQRFKLPISLGEILIDDSSTTVNIFQRQPPANTFICLIHTLHMNLADFRRTGKSREAGPGNR